MLRSVGADRVVDYTQEDFTRSCERYDLILDLAGNHPWSQCKRALTPDGTYVFSGFDQFGSSGHRWFGSPGRFAKLIVASPFMRHLYPFRGTKDPGDRLVVMKELIEARKITPVIDRTFLPSEVPRRLATSRPGRLKGRSSSPCEGSLPPLA
jgi:NADPH:quinone reductase-like Zn-dependent oxidoreductase